MIHCEDHMEQRDSCGPGGPSGVPGLSRVSGHGVSPVLQLIRELSLFAHLPLLLFLFLTIGAPGDPPVLLVLL